MAVQSAAGPDLGGFVTAPRLLGKNRIRMHRAKEIHQWLQPQPRCVRVCVTPSNMNKSLHADGGGYTHSHEGISSETKTPPQPYGRTHAQTRTHTRRGNNYYRGLDLCVKSISAFFFFFFSDDGRAALGTLISRE